MVKNPDKVINHMPDVCAGCGISLADRASHGIVKRQVVEIPPIQPVFVEHWSHSKECDCGYITQAAFPVGVNAPIQCSIKNMLDRVTRKSLPTYEKIRHFIQLSEEVGGDETGAKLNGDKWWFWVWQNVLATYITASDNRAFRTIEEHFPDGSQIFMYKSYPSPSFLRSAITHRYTDINT